MKYKSPKALFIFRLFWTKIKYKNWLKFFVKIMQLENIFSFKLMKTFRIYNKLKKFKLKTCVRV
jgi:hypothetical protein